MQTANITLERVLPIEQAFAAAREAVLEKADGENIFFYKDKTLQLQDLYPRELNSAALYLLEENVAFQRELRKYLLERYGIDTLRLSAVVHLRTEKGIIGMIPPYVEISEELVRIIPLDGDREPPPSQILNVPILIDGLHRAALADEEKIPLRCIVCSGNFDRRYLYTSYAAHGSEIKLYKKVPPVKKRYRRQKEYSFMRPLEVFRLTNVGVGGEYDRK